MRPLPLQSDTSTRAWDLNHRAAAKTIASKPSCERCIDKRSPCQPLLRKHVPQTVRLADGQSYCKSPPRGPTSSIKPRPVRLVEPWQPDLPQERKEPFSTSENYLRTCGAWLRAQRPETRRIATYVGGTCGGADAFRPNPCEGTPGQRTSTMN